MTGELVADYGGLPFVDPRFRPSRLLATVAAVRWSQYIDLLQQHGDGINQILSPKEMLGPAKAQELRELQSCVPSTPILHAPLSSQQREEVEAARDFIGKEMPHWQPLMSLPLRISLLLSDKAIGCSCFALPQQIFLSRRAFVSANELREQLLHEACHNWMYLLEEVGSFHFAGTGTRFVLPSGTSNRNAAEVIGAAHVTATLWLWYGRICDDFSSRRQKEVEDYFAGCLQILHDEAGRELTVRGREVCELLRLTYENKI